jgi:hypothetical protein
MVLAGTSESFCFEGSRMIRSQTLSASLPLHLTTAIAPFPGGVEIAQMVSSLEYKLIRIEPQNYS